MIRFYRRRLPHWRIDDGGVIYWVTWRLADGQPPLNPPERDLVVESLRRFDGQRYQLLAFVVMDNHVHAVVCPASGMPLERLTQGWKSFTAHRLHQSSGRVVPIWQPEPFDRVLRDERELQEKLAYVAANPGKRWPGITSYPWVWVLVQ
jgi:putative transposase